MIGYLPIGMTDWDDNDDDDDEDYAVGLFGLGLFRQPRPKADRQKVRFSFCRPTKKRPNIAAKAKADQEQAILLSH